MANDRIVLSLTEDDLKERTFGPAAPGWYPVEIDEVDVKVAGPNSKNPGKPMYGITYVSTDKDLHSGKFFGDNICLWQGAHYSLVGITKALGITSGPGELIVPTDDELLGKELEVRVIIEKYKKKDGSDGEKNVVKGYRALGGKAPAGKAKAKGFTL